MPPRTTGHTATWVEATIGPTTETGAITDRITIAAVTITTIDRAITRGIEASAPTDIVRTDPDRTDPDRTDIDRTDIERTDIGRIDADTVIIEAKVVTGDSVSDMPVGRTAGPAVDFRFPSVIDASSHPRFSRSTGSDA